MELPRYCIFASEIAAFIGENRYESYDKVCLRLWKIINAQSYHRCKKLADRRTNRTLLTLKQKATLVMCQADTERNRTAKANIIRATNNVAPSELKVCMKRMLDRDHLLTAMGPSSKCAKLEQTIKTCDDVTTRSIQNVITKASIDPKLVNEAKAILNDKSPAQAILDLSKLDGISKDQSVRLVEDLSKDISKNLSDNIQVPQIMESVHTAIENETRASETVIALKRVIHNKDKDVLPAISGLIHAGIGSRLENQSLDQYALRTKHPVVSRNSHVYRRYLCSGPKFQLEISGKVDGLQGEECVIETKQRRSRLFGRLCEREKIQVYTYLWLTRRKRGILVENRHTQSASYTIVFKKSEWNRYRYRVRTRVAKLHNILQDKDDEQRINLILRCMR